MKDTYKTSIYIGAGENGAKLVQAMEDACNTHGFISKQGKPVYSPLLIASFDLFYKLSPKVFDEADRLGIDPASYINMAVESFSKKKTREAL